MTGRRCPVGQAMKEEATAQLLRDDFRVSKRSRLTARAATRSGARVRSSVVHGGDGDSSSEEFCRVEQKL